MLHHFRRYQRYIYILITVVIIISFSFFGSYSALQRDTYVDTTAFVTIDGTSIPRSELEQFTMFIGTDSEEKRNYGGMWGPNFLNNGVIKRDLLETGVAQLLAQKYGEVIRPDIERAHSKEQHFKPYVHPSANFIGQEASWNYFVPGMKEQFSLLTKADDPLSEKAFDARVRLFLNERKFPAPLQQNMLRMQERQYNWIPHDRSLDYADLSLFGYHKAEDWFGQKFMRLMSEFIINSAIIAKERGYTVTPAEAYTDLIRNASNSFKQNQKSPHLNVGTVAQYLQEQLRIMGMDKNQAVKIWQQVLLFRRLYEDLGNSIFTDPFTFQEYNTFAYENVKGDLFHLPKDFHFSDERSLVKFETYLDGVAQKSERKDKLALPKKFKPVADVSPELVQKRYLVDMSEISTKQLEAKVGLRKVWNWESEEAHWSELTKQFPELALAKATTKKEREKSLDELDDTTRLRVDTYAREEIVKEHPEWIDQALEQAELQVQTLHIPYHGGKIAIKGVSDRDSLISSLDNASTSDPINKYSGDNKHYYRIHVIDKSESKEIMTYKEANQSGTLDELANKNLKAYYEKTRSQHGQEYKNSDGTWKSFDTVSDSVAGKYYGALVKEMGKRFIGGLIPKNDNQDLSMSRASSLRFLQHVADAKSSPETQESLMQEISDAEEGIYPKNKIGPRKPLTDQWSLQKREYSVARNSSDTTLDKQEALAMAPGEITKIYTPANGDLYFFKAKERGQTADEETLKDQVYGMHRLLAQEAQKELAKNLLKEMNQRGALNVDYLMPSQKNSEEIEENES